MSHHEHKRDAPETVVVAVVAVSDTRSIAEDRSGDEIAAQLEAAGHRVASREIVRDEPAQVGARVSALAEDAQVQAIVLTGGTGIAPRDTTYEAVDALLDKRLDGFGELFRMLSYEEVGSSAMLSRAVAGLVGRTVVFALPGSRAACRLAMQKLVVPELGHLVKLAAKVQR